MGAAASFTGETAQEFENFKKIRDEYETKVAAGATDAELYDHIQAVMSTLGASRLSLDLLAVKNEHNNCSEDIIKRANLNLLSSETSKVGEVKVKVEASLKAAAESNGWGTVTAIAAPCAVVTSRDNFDALKVPTGHYSRLPSDAYYCDQNTMLRTQLSAHLHSTITAAGSSSYYMSGETFRIIEEDEIQSEMQHKLEFVHVHDAPAAAEDDQAPEYMTVAESVVKALLPADSKMRWEESDEAFHLVGDAFNDLQVKHGEQVVDVARGGILTEEMLASLGFGEGKAAYVITFDLDHLAMVIHSVADIRQLHS